MAVRGWSVVSGAWGGGLGDVKCTNSDLYTITLLKKKWAVKYWGRLHAQKGQLYHKCFNNGEQFEHKG